MTHHHTPVWEHTERGLLVRIGGRVDPLPEPLQARLLDPDDTGTSADPAEDLLALEARLRRVVVDLTDRLGIAGREVADARTAVHDAGRPWWRPTRPGHGALRTALRRHHETTELLLQARSLRDALRDFVVELDPPSGPLADAAAGWRRDDRPPSSVIVFDDEDAFLGADTRRIGGAAHYPTPAGTVYGRQWRRDADDDPLARPPDHGGAWTVGHIPRTGEIYACRRSGSFDRQVWLLGVDFTAEQADTLLSAIEHRMREPNSVVLVASTVHAARFLRSAALGDAVRLHRPAVSDDGVPDDAVADPTQLEVAG